MTVTAADKEALRQLSGIHQASQENFVALKLENGDGKNHFLFLDSDHSRHKELKRQPTANPDTKKNGKPTGKIPRH